MIIFVFSLFFFNVTTTMTTLQRRQKVVSITNPIEYRADNFLPHAFSHSRRNSLHSISLCWKLNSPFVEKDTHSLSDWNSQTETTLADSQNTNLIVNKHCFIAYVEYNIATSPMQAILMKGSNF